MEILIQNIRKKVVSFVAYVVYMYSDYIFSNAESNIVLGLIASIIHVTLQAQLTSAAVQRLEYVCILTDFNS